MCRPLTHNTQLARIPVKENMESQNEYQEISENQGPGKGLLSTGVYRKTTAVKFMTADKIYGKSGYEYQQHGIDDQRGGSWIKPGNQGQPGDKLQERHNDGNQVDKDGREKVIPENYFCKNSRRQNLVGTGIYKGHTKNPACCQLNPAVIIEGFDKFIQLDALRLPSPESRR